MNITISQSFLVGLCYEEPGGNEAIRFDIEHHYKILHQGALVVSRSDTILSAESNLAREAYEDEDGYFCLEGFRVKYLRGCKQVKFGTGRKAYRFKVVGMGSGGNIYWETVGFPHAVVPHVFNWLRRQKFSLIEEDLEFSREVWNVRQPLDQSRIFKYGVKSAKATLKYHAKLLGMTTKQFIERAYIQYHQ